MTIDAATACKRYQESMTPTLLMQFERILFERFGVTPLSKVPPEEAIKIYQELLGAEEYEEGCNIPSYMRV